MLENRCEIISEKLFEYIDGELPQDEMKLIETHIGSCPDCNAELARCREALRLLKLSEYTPDKDLLDSVLKKNVKNRFSILPFGTVAAAAAIALVVFSNSGIFSNFFAKATADNAAAPEAAFDVADTNYSEVGSALNDETNPAEEVYMYAASASGTVAETNATNGNNFYKSEIVETNDFDGIVNDSANEKLTAEYPIPESIIITFKAPTHTSPLVTEAITGNLSAADTAIPFTDLVSKYLFDYLDKPIMLFVTTELSAVPPAGYQLLSDDSNEFTAYIYKYSTQLASDIKRTLHDAQNDYVLYEMYDKYDTIILLNLTSGSEK